MNSSTSTSTLWSNQTPIPKTQFGMSSTPAPVATTFGSYGTRRASVSEATPKLKFPTQSPRPKQSAHLDLIHRLQAMAINHSASPAVSNSPLPSGSPAFGSPATSSSVKKSGATPKLKARRLSSSSVAMRSPMMGSGLGLSASVPANAHQAHAIANARARGATKSEALYGSPSLGLGMIGVGEEDELEEGELRGAEREGAGTIYECEKCKKVSCSASSCVRRGELWLGGADLFVRLVGTSSPAGVQARAMPGQTPVGAHGSLEVFVALAPVQAPAGSASRGCRNP